MPRGGKRQGAGRKKTSLSRTAKSLKRTTAEEILADQDEMALWADLIKAETQLVVGKGDKQQVVTVVDKRLRFDALRYLSDKRDGKAPMAGEDRGAPVVIQFVRDPRTPAIQVAITPRV